MSESGEDRQDERNEDVLEEEADILEFELGKAAFKYIAGSIVGAAIGRLLKLGNTLTTGLAALGGFVAVFF